MFQLSLILSSLLILSALVPFVMKRRLDSFLVYVIWSLVWFMVVAATNATRYPPAVHWLLLLLVFAIPVARWTKLKWSWFQVICLFCAFVAYGISLFEFRPIFQEHQELLARYPAIDLKPRLSYEQLSADVGADFRIITEGFNTSTEAPRHDIQTLQQLDERMRQYLDSSTYSLEYRRNDRRLAFQGLMRVHEGFVEDFIAQPGQGRSRLPALHLLRKDDLKEYWYDVHLDNPPELLDQPDPVEETSASADLAPPADQAIDKRVVADDKSVRKQLDSLPQRETVQAFHLHNITNFVPLNSLGGINDKLEARGFHSHAFRLAPHKMDSRIEIGQWRLARLELVSLLKHRPPAVYVSKHLPAMDELRDAPTRPATQFELNAISKFVDGEDLVLETSSRHELRVMGSIRAIAECRKCHQVPLAGLLGAFSYTFHQETVRRPVPRTGDKKVTFVNSKRPGIHNFLLD